MTRILNCATTLRAAIVLYHFFFFLFSLFFYLSLNYNGRKFPQTAKVPRKIRLYRANELLSNLKQNFQLESRRLHFYYLLLVENDPFPNNHPRKPFPRCENKRRNNGVVVRVISPVLHFARKTNIKIYASVFFFFLRDYKEDKKCDWIINSFFSSIHEKYPEFYYKSRITIAKNIILIFVLLRVRENL